MRIISASILSLALVGCGGLKTDPTPNQTLEGQDYVSGPFGYAEGSVIENIKFVAKWDPSGAKGTATYDTLPMQPLSMADLYKDRNTTRYVVMSGVAGWCGPCNDEQQFVPSQQAQYEPKGFRFLEAMIQGYNEKTGAPATEADVNSWAARHSLHVSLGLDPEDKIHQYADVAAFPLNMIVRTSDMTIVFMKIGEQDLGSVLANLP